MQHLLAACLLVTCGGGHGGQGQSDAPALGVEGAPCSSAAECQSDYCIFGLSYSACGKCAAGGASDGEPCSLSAPCVHADSCVGSNGATTCIPRAAEGEACDYTHATAPSCRPGMRCEANQTCMSVGGNCGIQLPDGEFVGCAMGEACVVGDTAECMPAKCP